MKWLIYITLILVFLAINTHSVNDTIILQQGLNNYKGTGDTYIQSGWYQSAHATGGSATRLLIGTSWNTDPDARGLVKFELEAVANVTNIQKVFFSIFMDEDIFADDIEKNPEGNLRLSYLNKHFDPATAMGIDYGKGDPLKFSSAPPTISKVFTPRGDDKRWYHLEIPANDMADFISGAKQNYGFMICHSATATSKYCSNKYFISSENNLQNFRPKLVIIYGDDIVVSNTSDNKTKCSEESLFSRKNSNIIINADLNHMLSLAIYNIQGKSLIKQTINNSSTKISVSNLINSYPDGLYICTLNYKNKTYNLKINK